MGENPDLSTEYIDAAPLDALLNYALQESKGHSLNVDDEPDLTITEAAVYQRIGLRATGDPDVLEHVLAWYATETDHNVEARRVVFNSLGHTFALTAKPIPEHIVDTFSMELQCSYDPADQTMYFMLSEMTEAPEGANENIEIAEFERSKPDEVSALEMIEQQRAEMLAALDDQYKQPLASMNQFYMQLLRNLDHSPQDEADQDLILESYDKPEKLVRIINERELSSERALTAARFRHDSLAIELALDDKEAMYRLATNDGALYTPNAVNIARVTYLQMLFFDDFNNREALEAGIKSGTYDDDTIHEAAELQADLLLLETTGITMRGTKRLAQNEGFFYQPASFELARVAADEARRNHWYFGRPLVIKGDLAEGLYLTEIGAARAQEDVDEYESRNQPDDKN